MRRSSQRPVPGNAISVAADPADSCRVVVATQFNLIRSDDCGVSWQEWDPETPSALHSDHHMLAFHTTDRVLYLGSDGGLAAINMAVQPAPVHGCKAKQPTPLDCSVPLNCWTNRNRGFATDQLYSLQVSDAWNFSAGRPLICKTTALRLACPTTTTRLGGRPEAAMVGRAPSIPKIATSPM